MTPTDAIELAREAGIHHLFDEIYEAEADALLAFANLVEARVKERAAKVCEEYSEVNMEICGDNILMDPLLSGGAWTAANLKRSDDCSINSTIHSAQHHAGQHLASAIRSME